MVNGLCLGRRYRLEGMDVGRIEMGRTDLFRFVQGARWIGGAGEALAHRGRKNRA